MKTLFLLRFTNVCCSAEGESFSSLKKAVDRGRECGFEFSVWKDGKKAASWTVFGGLQVEGAASRSEARRIRHGLEG